MTGQNRQKTVPNPSLLIQVADCMKGAANLRLLTIRRKNRTGKHKKSIEKTPLFGYDRKQCKKSSTRDGTSSA